MKEKPYGGNKKKYFGSYNSYSDAVRNKRSLSKAYTGKFYVTKRHSSFAKTQYPGKYLVKRK